MLRHYTTEAILTYLPVSKMDGILRTGEAAQAPTSLSAMAKAATLFLFRQAGLPTTLASYGHFFGGFLAGVVAAPALFRYLTKNQADLAMVQLAIFHVLRLVESRPDYRALKERPQELLALMDDELMRLVEKHLSQDEARDVYKELKRHIDDADAEQQKQKRARAARLSKKPQPMGPIRPADYPSYRLAARPTPTPIYPWGMPPHYPPGVIPGPSGSRIKFPTDGGDPVPSTGVRPSSQTQDEVDGECSVHLDESIDSDLLPEQIRAEARLSEDSTKLNSFSRHPAQQMPGQFPTSPSPWARRSAAPSPESEPSIKAKGKQQATAASSPHPAQHVSYGLDYSSRDLYSSDSDHESEEETEDEEAPVPPRSPFDNANPSGLQEVLARFKACSKHVQTNAGPSRPRKKVHWAPSVDGVENSELYMMSGALPPPELPQAQETRSTSPPNKRKSPSPSPDDATDATPSPAPKRLRPTPLTQVTTSANTIPRKPSPPSGTSTYTPAQQPEPKSKPQPFKKGRGRGRTGGIAHIAPTKPATLRAPKTPKAPKVQQDRAELPALRTSSSREAQFPGTYPQ